MDSKHTSRCMPCNLFPRLFGRKRGHRDTNLSQPPPPYDTAGYLKAAQRMAINDPNLLQNGPTVRQYALEATKKTIELFKSVAELAGVPLVIQVLDLGLGVISLFEQLDQVQTRVQDLQRRIADFLVVIARFMLPENQTDADECAKVLKTMSDDLKEDLQDLKSCLDFITQGLQHIKNQNKALTTLLPGSNMTEIERWEKAFQDAVDRFQTLRDLHASQDLAKIQQDLQRIHEVMINQLGGMKKQLTSLEHKLDTCVEEFRARLASEGTGHQAIPKVPKIPPHFYGRDDIVDKIAKTLCGFEDEGTSSRVCILGSGGLGKSSIAFAVMRQNDLKAVFKERQFFVLCTSATSPSALLGALAQSVGIPPQTNDVLDAIVTRLTASSDPCVMLLDNFETPWQSRDAQLHQSMTVSDILERLDSLPHLAILLTMRSGPDCVPLPHWKCENLTGVDLTAARAIYTAIDTSVKESPDLDNLLTALDHMPYAISLMASLGRRSLSSPTKLLHEWRNRGTDLIKQGMDRAIGLSVNSNFVTSCPGAVELLQRLSMLPAGTPRTHLDLWFDSYSPEAIATLRESALLHVGYGDDPLLFVLPVVQSYMKKDIPLNIHQQVHGTCLKLLRDHNAPIKGPNDVTRFKEHIEFLMMEERNVEALLTEMLIYASTALSPSMPPGAMYVFQVFSWYQYWTQPRPELTEKVVTAADIDKDYQGMADALFCLGKMLCKIDRYADAYNVFARARELFLTLDSPTSQHAAILCALEQVEALTWSQPGSEEARASLEALAVRCQGDSFLEAVCLRHMAALQWQEDLDSEALRSLEASRDLFDKSKCPYESTCCLHDMAKVLASLQQHEKALNVIDLAIERFNTLGVSGDAAVVFSVIFKVRCLKMLDRPEVEVMKTLDVALELSRHTGRPLALAQTLEEYGEVYVQREDWPAAALAYEEAEKAVSRVDSSADGRQDIPERCTNNLRYIQARQGDRTLDGISFIPPLRC